MLRMVISIGMANEWLVEIAMVDNLFTNPTLCFNPTLFLHWMKNSSNVSMAVLTVSSVASVMNYYVSEFTKFRCIW